MPMGKRSCFSENVKAQSDGAAAGRGIILLQGEPSMRAGIIGEEPEELPECAGIIGEEQEELPERAGIMEEEPEELPDRAGIMGEELKALSESPVISGIAQKEPAVPSSHGRGPMGRGGIVPVLPVLESS